MKIENEKTGGGLANLANLANCTLEMAKQAANQRARREIPKLSNRGTANTDVRVLTAVTAVGHLGKSGDFRPSDSRPQHSADVQRRISTTAMTAEDEKAIRTWLAHIEESDPGEIQSVLDECRRDPGCLTYFLGRAREIPR